MTDFTTWTQPSLARIAADLSAENKVLREALEQVRQDLKDAMQLLRDRVNT